jgi:hypothetical protein
MQVTKASEDQRLDQHRMLLGINHKGNIVSVNAGGYLTQSDRIAVAVFNLVLAGAADHHDALYCCKISCAGASRSLFGFEGQQLVGQPLSSAIDIFTDWKQGHREELSLLQLLVRQLMASDPAATKVTSVCASWRVGVHRPAASGHADEAVRMQQLFSKLGCSRPATTARLTSDRCRHAACCSDCLAALHCRALPWDHMATACCTRYSPTECSQPV